MSPEFVSRFWSKVEKSDGCWLWKGAKKGRGYGHMNFQGSFFGTHRISYTIHKGPIPSGMLVCHACDVPSCVNPDHLWLGTVQDNCDDMISKGRRRNGVTCGEANHFSKLTSDQIEAIRAAPKVYGSGRALAALYGVREAQICHIRAGRSWVGQ